MSFSHICIIALLATGVASSDSCDANDQACVEDEGPDLSEFLQRAASVNKGEQNSIGMQQATIDRMLDEVQHMGDKRIDGKLPPAQQEQVTAIKEILENSLLPSLESVHDDAQNELGTLIGGISTCNENSVTLQGSIGGQGGVAELVVSARSSHATCRGDEANKLAAVNAATSDMTAFINSIPTVPAQPLTFGAEENIQYLETVETRLCGLHDQLVTKKQHYDNTTSEHAAATTNCNHLQVQFEQDYCSWRLELTDACNTLQSCYGAAVGAYNTRSAAVQTLEAQWKTEYTGIKKILCFVDIWMSDNDVTTVDDSQLATCDDLQVDTSRMDMTYPDVPPQGSCDTSQVQQYPGTAEFAASEYNQFSATGVADSLTCTALTGQSAGWQSLAVFGQSGINSEDDLRSAGWDFAALTHINFDGDGRYITGPDFFSFFGDSQAVGYVEKTIPGDGGCVKVRWGGSCCGFTRLYIGGTQVEEILGQTQETDRTSCALYSAGDKVKLADEDINIAHIWSVDYQAGSTSCQCST